MQVEEGRTCVARAALEAALHRMPGRHGDNRDNPRHTPDALKIPGDQDRTPRNASRCH
jgi:hypothetical protein